MYFLVESTKKTFFKLKNERFPEAQKKPIAAVKLWANLQRANAGAESDQKLNMLKPQCHFELNLSQAFDVYKKVTFIITSGEIELGFIKKITKKPF